MVYYQLFSLDHKEPYMYNIFHGSCGHMERNCWLISSNKQNKWVCSVNKNENNKFYLKVLSWYTRSPYRENKPTTKNKKYVQNTQKDKNRVKTMHFELGGIGNCIVYNINIKSVLSKVHLVNEMKILEY